MAIVTSCRSDMSPEGLSRNAHLADGRMHLVLVHQCSILQYLKFLSLIPTCGRYPHRIFLQFDHNLFLTLLGPLLFLLIDSSLGPARTYASSTRTYRGMHILVLSTRVAAPAEIAHPWPTERLPM